jgi:thioredoxin reductase
MRRETIAVVIVGGGSAAFEAAVAAKQAGAPNVVRLEKAPEPEFEAMHVPSIDPWPMPPATSSIYSSTITLHAPGRRAT